VKLGVKLAEFKDLCDREWAKTDRGGRGDVVALVLTEASRSELADDVIVNPQQFGHILHIKADDASDLPPISQVVNPITRSVVTIRTRADGKRETARVRTPFGYRQTWWPAST
jgi:hypothetical protein